MAKRTMSIPSKMRDTLPMELQDILPQNKFVAIRTPKDGNSVFHSFLLAHNSSYASKAADIQPVQLASYRKTFASKVDKVLSDKDDDPFFDAEEFKQLFENDSSWKQFGKKLSTPDKWTGDHTWTLLEAYEKVNILLVNRSEEDGAYHIVCRGLDPHNIPYNQSVIILQKSSKHFQPIVRINQDSTDGTFDNDDIELKTFFDKLREDCNSLRSKLLTEVKEDEDSPEDKPEDSPEDSPKDEDSKDDLLEEIGDDDAKPEDAKPEDAKPEDEKPEVVEPKKDKPVEGKPKVEVAEVAEAADVFSSSTAAISSSTCSVVTSLSIASV